MVTILLYMAFDGNECGINEKSFSQIRGTFFPIFPVFGSIHRSETGHNIFPG